jgi:hypothetical protein
VAIARRGDIFHFRRAGVADRAGWRHEIILQVAAVTWFCTPVAG